jgi:hypothetical protein
MSEAMALERMTQMLAELEGYLTATRLPYLPRYTKSGKEKTGAQHGDLDLVGIGPEPERRLLVAECKGYGSPEDYPSWLTSDYLWHLHDLVYNASSNIQSVAHVRWESEFEAGGHRPDEAWIVFPGSFFPRSNPARWRLPKGELCRQIVEDMIEAARPVWRSRGDGKQRQHEVTLLAKAEELLGEINQVRVRLLPVHRLLRELFLRVPEDMLRRRKRYPDTAMEMLRWITRAVGRQVLDLGEIQAEIRRVLGEGSALNT